MSPDRLLVLHAGALGDFILTLHLVARLRDSSSRHVTLAARSSWGHWAADHGYTDEAYLLDAVGFSDLYLCPPQCGTGLRALLDQTDRVVSLLGNANEPANKGLLDMGLRVHAIDPRPTAETLANGTHIVDQWTAQLAESGFDFGASVEPACSGAEASVRNNRSEEDRRRRLLAGTSPRVIIHPGSGGLVKCCPIDALEALPERLRNEGCDVRWMLGPDELERFGPELETRLGASAPVVVSMCGAEAMLALESTDLYIGMDAGMTHAAALIGAATIAIFGPTDPRVWRPLGARVVVAPFPTRGGDARAWASTLVETCMAWRRRQAGCGAM